MREEPHADLFFHIKEEEAITSSSHIRLIRWELSKMII